MFSLPMMILPRSESEASHLGMSEAPGPPPATIAGVGTSTEGAAPPLAAMQPPHFPAAPAVPMPATSVGVGARWTPLTMAVYMWLTAAALRCRRGLAGTHGSAGLERVRKRREGCGRFDTDGNGQTRNRLTGRGERAPPAVDGGASGSVV